MSSTLIGFHQIELDCLTGIMPVLVTSTSGDIREECWTRDEILAAVDDPSVTQVKPALESMKVG